MHIYSGYWVIIGLDNGLAPQGCQAIILTKMIYH